jgi:hypothetical protein
MREIEYTRRFIGCCVVLCVQVGMLVGWWLGESASALGDRRVCV